MKENKVKKKIQLKIRGMTCPSCAAHATQSLSQVEGVASVTIKDWKSGLADLSIQNGKLPDASDWNAALAEHGYTATLLPEVPKEGDPVSEDSSPSEKTRVEAGQNKRLSSASRFDTDLLVIGTGGGGMGAALEAARLGKRVTIVEKGTIGGCCVNVGCIPSKALLSAAHLRHAALHSPFSGLSFQEDENNWQELLKNRRNLVETLRHEKYEKVLEGFDTITLKRAQASFEQDADGHPLVLCDDGSRIRAEKYVIATGSRPQSPGIAGEKETGLLDSTAALFLEKKPASLAVIGGGFVAAELTQAFSRLGVPIVGLAVRSRLLSKWDTEISEALQKSLESEGIPVFAGQLPVRFFREGGLKCVELQGQGGKRQVLKAEEILLATGRIANTEDLNLELFGITRDAQSGEIPVSPFLETSHPAIYAVGDASSLPSLVYVAARAGKIAAAHAFGESNGARIEAIDTDNIPEVVFTQPECAQVGLSLAKALERGIEAEESKLELKDLPRAIVSEQKRGFVKLVVEKESDRILGAHIFAPRAGELIQTASLAIAMGKKYGLRAEDLRNMLFAYLTESEGIKLSAQTLTMQLGRLSCCAG